MCQLKKYILTSQKSRKRKSDRLNPEATTTTNVDTINRFTAVFEDKDAGVLEENHVFPNDTTTTNAAEEVRVEVEKNKNQTGHRQKFPEDILKFRFMKQSCDLLFRCQQDRTNDVSKQILASCVDRKKLKETGMEYIQNNMDLALDVVTFIDLLIYNLSSKLHINLLHLDNIECYNVVHDGDDKDTVVGGLRTKQKVDHKLACDLLKEMTGKAYDRLSKFGCQRSSWISIENRTI